MQMEYLIEHFAVAVCAITGVLAAKGKRVDLFGIIVLALVTALGGGTLRDLILQKPPVFWVADPNYVTTATVAAVATFFAVRFWEIPQPALMVADAFGLALFTTVGTEKSLQFCHSPEVAVLLGVMTGVAGGMMRDTLTGEIPLVFRKEIYLYATASLFGAIVLALLDSWLPGKMSNRLIAIGVILVLRLAAIHWKIPLPVFTQRDEPRDPRDSR